MRVTLYNESPRGQDRRTQTEWLFHVRRVDVDFSQVSVKRRCRWVCGIDVIIAGRYKSYGARRYARFSYYRLMENER